MTIDRKTLPNPLPRVSVGPVPEGLFVTIVADRMFPAAVVGLYGWAIPAQ